jgi:ribosomal protein L16 Arg81 hydroxylase
MIDAGTNPFDLRRVFASVGVERFFNDFWQRRILALELDANDFASVADEVGPLEIARLARLAREGTKAWIANEYVAHSVVPVDASNAAEFFDVGATLYFLNLPMERITHGLAAFLGAPQQRIIASLFLTPAVGGASAHFDRNENFTIQLTGAKQWTVGDAPLVAAPLDGHVLGQQVPASLADILDVRKEMPSHTVTMRPGMLLYVPRGTLHRTEAGEMSWSLNLSYSHATWIDLLRVGLERRLAGSARWRGTVTGVGSSCDPHARAANILPELAAELCDMLADPRELDRFAEDFFRWPKD